MEKFVITVGRQFGSMGRPIAKTLAEKLGINYFDRDIVEEVAKRMNMPLSIVSNEEEAASSKFGQFGKMLFPLGKQTTELQDKIFEVQRCVIMDFIDKGPCILVGRCADYIARDCANLFRIYIYAPFEERVKNCVQFLNMTESDALKMCRDVDRARSAYHKQYAGYDCMSGEVMDCMINSSSLGIDGTISALEVLIRQRFQL
ncbi:MAG: cytidylate kinase-like family protein [Treponema sp.]|nr:cytidylate kinase-like family protein [Treponema sp.]